MRPGIFVGHSSVDGDGEVIERLNKYCSHAGEKGGKRTGKSEHAVFLGLRFVSAQSQAAAGMLLRQRPMIGSTRSNPKILAPPGYSIFVSPPGLVRKKS